MKKFFHPLSAITAAILIICACNGNGSDPGDDPGTPGRQVTPSFATGSDVSWLSEMEKDGRKFSDDSGNTDLFVILKGLGQNSIRLRVWVGPQGGWSGKDDVVSLAGRAAAAGLSIMIDFHYSDFFADPSRQTIPAAWTDHTPASLAAKVKDHTTEVLSALKAAGISPAWVQVGNETRNGMLWPAGKLWKSSDSDTDTPGGWNNYATLFKAGYSAVKAVFPDAKVIAHLDRGQEENEWWFNDLKTHGAAFDMIGLSYYPTKGSWTSSNSALASNIKKLGTSFGVPVMVSEIGIEASDLSDGAKCISDVMSKIKPLECCAGVFYWEPEVYGGWKPAIYNSLGWAPYAKGAFTSAGKPSEALKAMK